MPNFLVNRNGMPINTRTYTPTPLVITVPTPTPLVITVLHNYDITFDSDVTVQTLLTSCPSRVDSWFLETLRLHYPNPLLVGLDVEWRPNFQRGVSNAVAILQLCINHRCLVFQIIHAPFLPNSLLSFLANPNHTFVGVGIQADVKKLLEDYSIHVANFVDLRSLAADVLGDRQMLSTGIKTLAQRVLGKEVKKPKRITRSRWDNRWLTRNQVHTKRRNRLKAKTMNGVVFVMVNSRLAKNKTQRKAREYEDLISESEWVSGDEDEGTSTQGNETIDVDDDEDDDDDPEAT